MSTDRTGVLETVYRNRIREPRTTDEVYGYWLFVLGVLLGLLGLFLAIGSEAASTRRGLAVVVLGVALLAILLGSVVRLELRRLANYIAVLGALVGLAAIVWFWSVYPNDWQFGEQQVWNVIGLGAAGIGLMVVAAVVVPLVTDPREADITAAEAAGAAAEAETATRDTQLEDAEATLAAIEDSKAQFELYEDAAGEYRWRLRHRNSNVIADGGEGYSSRQKAQQGIGSVKHNAYGAAVVNLEDLDVSVDAVDDATDGAEAPAVLTEADSQATYERYEDGAGEHRWRLRHDNGQILADSGEGYATRSGLGDGIDLVRQYVPPAAYLRVDPAAFEVYTDSAGQWRWRLIHVNGNVLADSGEGYSGRTRCREGAESVMRNVAEDGEAEFEVYEDNRNEHRWRLRHANGEIIADSGEGYSSEAEAEDAVDRVREYAPEADLLAVGQAVLEIFEDAAGEWRWHLRHRNGNVLAESGEGYGSRSAATAAVTRLKRHAPGADEETVEE